MAQAAFRELLRSIGARYTTQKEFAAALHMDAGHLSHVLSGHSQPFGVPACLQLAVLANRSALEILRLAGQVEEANLLEVLAVRGDLTVSERRLLVIWKRFPPAIHNALLSILEQIAALWATGGRPPRTRRRSTRTRT